MKPQRVDLAAILTNLLQQDLGGGSFGGPFGRTATGRRRHAGQCYLDREPGRMWRSIAGHLFIGRQGQTAALGPFLKGRLGVLQRQGGSQ